MMTDRHLHCVYFKYDNPDKIEGFCLLKNKKIEHGFKPHCKNWVLRPHMLISYYLKHEGICNDWADADDKALEYLKKVGFNDYPDGDSE